MKTITKILGIVMILGLVFGFMPARTASAADINVNCSSGCDQTQIQAAIDSAVDGDTINVSGGPYVLTAAINLTKAVTLDGGGTTLIQVSGTGDRFDISAGATLKGFQIQKTDKTGEQNIIRVRASDITIQNNIIWGQWAVGDGEVSRAMVFNAGGFSGLLIDNNEIYGLRQPGYISGTHNGVISNNYVHGTKGWVLEGGNLTFTGNTWAGNVGDIAIIPSCPAIYYTDILALSTANNGAVVEDQRVSPAVLAVVYVDDSAAAGGNGTQALPLQTIQGGIDRVIAGGTVKVAAGTYAEDLEIGKSITILGPNAAISPNTGTRGTEAVIAPVDEVGIADPAVLATAGSMTVTIKGLTFDMSGTTDNNDRFVEAINKTGVTMNVEKNIFTGAPETINGNWYITGTTNPFSLTLVDNYIHHNGTSNGISLWGDGHTVDIRDNVWKDNKGWAVNFNFVTGTFSGNQVLDTVEDGPNWYDEQAGFLFASANNLTLTGNTMDGLPNPYIRLYPSFAGTLNITGNNFSNSEDPLMGVLRISDGADLSGVKVEKNALLNDTLVGQNMDAELLDASPNWFGSAAGPALTQFDGPVSYIPWCTNAACTTFGYPPVHNVTQDTYFYQIQAAITAASPADVINVAAGTYVEDIVINKALTLQGAGRDTTTIQGVATGVGGVVRLGASNVTIDGFTIQAPLGGKKGIQITAATDAFHFTNNKLVMAANAALENGYAGIETYYNTAQTNHVISNNIFVADHSSQLVYYNPTAANVTFTNNQVIGTMMPNGAVLVFETPVLPFTFTGNSVADSLIGAYGFFGAPGLTSAQMNSVFVSNSWPTNSAVVGTDILIPLPVHNLTKDTYFNTIQAAIDDAGTTNGDVIVVRAGTYPEAVNVYKEVTLLGSQNVRSFTDTVLVGSGAAPNTWYTDRFAPAVFESASFDGDMRLKHGVRAPAQSSSFYNYQGRKLDVNTSGAIQTISIDLYVDPAWATTSANAGIWATGFDASNAISAYPIVAWRSGGTIVPGFYSFDYVDSGAWLPLKTATAEDYGKWHTLTMTYEVGTGVKYFVDGEFKLAFADAVTATIGNVILNVYNFGADYDVYWDNLSTYSFGATVAGQMTINASNVTVDGFVMTNPGLTYGMLVNPGFAHIDITNNIFENIGSMTQASQVKGIYLLKGPDDILISNNIFRNIRSGTNGVNAIFSGDTSPLVSPVVGLTIQGNTFQNISSATKGGYGILLNNGSGNEGVDISGNTFSAISGGWTHAIGLEGPTPGALVTGNSFSTLTAAGADNVAVFFEDNPAGGSVTVEDNNFNNVGYGVAIAGNDLLTLGYTVDASPNWWGSACGPTAGFANAGPNVSFNPWYTVAGTTLSGAPTTTVFPAGTSTAAMNAAIACAVPGSTFEFSSGDHFGDIQVPAGRTNMTLRLMDGAIINANSPCFTVGADYTTIEAASIGGAVCLPTLGSNGIDIAPFIRNVTIDGLEIRGKDMTGADLATGDGIHFAGVVIDTVLVDNFIHDLDGNGIFFGAQPVALTLGAIDIHGNMFQNNTGVGISNASGTAPIDATFNSWGDLGGPAGPNGDGVSANVTYSPFTHVDLLMQASGTPWLNQVVSGETITYTVKANLWNANAADFVLKYPANLTYASSSVNGTFGLTEILTHNAGARTLNFQAYSTTGNLTPTNPVTLFTVTFTAGDTGSGTMNLDELTDGFGMVGVGSSSNIYAAALVDGTVNVIDLPVMDIVPTAPYIAGLPIPFTLNITNTNGGAYTALNLEFTAPAGTVLEYWDGDSWEPVSDPFTLGALTAGGTLAPQFRVTFTTPGANTLSVDLVDTLADPATTVLATASEPFTVLGNFTIKGTFSMQGRAFRGGLPVTLTRTVALYGPYSAPTINVISQNLTLLNVNGGTYAITTSQPRYLNVVAANNKTLLVDGAKIMNALELKGGNATDAGFSLNRVDVDDASAVGTAYGVGDITSNGDVNFDGKVNIQDLALVGGNFYLTSEVAYGIGNIAPWVP